MVRNRGTDDEGRGPDSRCRLDSRSHSRSAFAATINFQRADVTRTPGGRVSEGKITGQNNLVGGVCGMSSQLVGAGA